MFYANDRVKYTGDFNTGLIGKIGTVKEDMEEGSNNVMVLFDDDYPRLTRGVMPRNITHVTNVPSAAEAELRRLARGSAATPAVRTFASGATRDTDENKLDFEGFLSPLVLKAFAEYMHGKRKMADGSLRDSDNWQKGIPLDAYMKSMWRHFFAVWESHRRGTDTPEEDLKALLFNVQGYLHETLKAKQSGV